MAKMPSISCEIERPINLVVQYMYVLTHKVKKKIHAIGIDEQVDPVFLQPRKGQKNDGGQSFGEMELWCLASVGANKVIQEIYSTMSDDISNRKSVVEEMKLPQSLSLSQSNSTLTLPATAPPGNPPYQINPGCAAQLYPAPGCQTVPESPNL